MAVTLAFAACGDDGATGMTEDEIEPVPTQGPTATLVWDGSAITVSMLPADRGTDFYDAEEFASLLAAVGHTDARTWLGVLPERVVTADTRGQVVDALLAGVPLPEDRRLGA